MAQSLCMSSCLPIVPSERKASNPTEDTSIYGELSSVSFVQNKESLVRIVLASGMVEVYDSVVSASSVLEKYPGLCLAHPDIFKKPNQALIGANEMLYPGEKFYLIPKTTVKKLQRDISQRANELKDCKVGRSKKDKCLKKSKKDRRGLSNGWKPTLTSVVELSPVA